MDQASSVLIVDDEQDAVDAMTSSLSQQGFEVASASRWTEAIVQIQEDPPSVVLLDLHLPTVQGEALLEFIRETHKDLPVVIVASDIDAGRMARLGELGANGFIRKPFEADDLVVVLEQVLAELGPSVPGDVEAPSVHPLVTPSAPSPPRGVSPGSGVEALEQRLPSEGAAPASVRRRRSRKRRKLRVKRVWNYLLAFALILLISLLLWAARDTLSTGFMFGITSSNSGDQAE